MRGFTLIEMIVYIALLSLLMAGTLAATYELLAGQSKSSGHDTTEEEGGFVLSKFEWAMGQITATDTPSLTSPSTHEFAVQSAREWVQFCRVGSAVMMREGAVKDACGNDALWEPLTTSNVKVTGLDFTYLPAVGGGPDGIVASTTIDGVIFSATRYLRN